MAGNDRQVGDKAGTDIRVVLNHTLLFMFLSYNFRIVNY